jgi:hypothetical protein
MKSSPAGNATTTEILQIFQLSKAEWKENSVMVDEEDGEPAGELYPDAWFEERIGSQIGKPGGARAVFENTEDSGTVIKKVNGFPGPNFVEHFMWAQIRRTPHAKYFGRISAISESGKYLMMERLDSLDANEVDKTPTIPDFVRDVWVNNFGKNRNSEIKIRDYANINLGEALSRAETYRHRWQKETE